MENEDESVSVMFYPKKSTAIWILLASCGFVAIGIWMVMSGEFMGYLCAGFFALGIPVAILRLIPGNAYLRLDMEGFTFCSLFRKTTVAWSNVAEFFVVKMSQNGVKVYEMVGFNFVPTYDKSQISRMLSRSMGDCEAGLPDTYGKKAEELAVLMNSFLANR